MDQPDGQMGPLTLLGMDASSLVLPESSAKEQDRMLIKCINYKATLYAIRYSASYLKYPQHQYLTKLIDEINVYPVGNSIAQIIPLVRNCSHFVALYTI